MQVRDGCRLMLFYENGTGAQILPPHQRKDPALIKMATFLGDVWYVKA